MMFKKWRITGQNKLRHLIAGLLALCLLAGMPAMAEAPLPQDQGTYSLQVEGFELAFDVDTDYYLCQPADFDQCKILGYTGFKALTVDVEQYASYHPYKETAYVWGDALKLGNGRAKITLIATLQDDSTREYLIALADPDGADYAYAHARVNTSVKFRKAPYADAEVHKDAAGNTITFVNNAQVYYLKTEGDWCMVEQIYYGRIGYIHKDYLRWGWLETEMPAEYKASIEALQAAHPNWTFEFVDVERDYTTYIQSVAKQRAATRADAEGYSGQAYKTKVEEYTAFYLPEVQTYLDPKYYLAEDKIFAMLNIDVYDQETWNDEGIAAIWANENALSKAQAVEYFNAASKSLLMNPLYIACRAALESGYGTSKFAKGTVAGYEGYYNFFGIQCFDSDPTVGAAYAKKRNWNSVFRSIVGGANWIKDQYLDQGAITPYFFRYAGFQNKSYMSDLQAPIKEASILKRAFTDPNAKAHFVIPVYQGYSEEKTLALNVTATIGETVYTAAPDEKGEPVLKLPANTESVTLQITPALPEGATSEGVAIRLFADPARKIAAAESISLVQKITTVYGSHPKGSYTLNGKEIPFAAGNFAVKIVSDRDVMEYKDAASYADHWVKPYIEALNNGKHGIFKGDENGNLNIAANITRYEIAAIATRVLGLDVGCFNEQNAAFVYGDSIEEWAIPAVRAAASVGIMNGHNVDGKLIFNGEDFATREQVIKVLVSVCVVNAGGTATGTEDAATAYYNKNKATVDAEFKKYTFRDTGEISEWAIPYMKLAVADFKMIGGSKESDGKLYLHPTQNITRAEVAKMVAVYYED